MKLNDHSIQGRLVKVLTTMVLVIFLVGAVAVWFLIRSELIEQMDLSLAETVEDFIAETERELDGSIDAGMHDLELRRFQEADDGDSEDGTGGSYYQMWDAGFVSIVRSESLNEDENLKYHDGEIDELAFEPINLPNGKRARAALIVFQLELEEFDLTDPEEADDFASRSDEEIAYSKAYDTSALENRVYLTMAKETGELEGTLISLAFMLAVTGVLISLAVIVLIRSLVKSACQPVLDLAAVTSRISHGAFNTRLPTDGVPDEVKPLVLKFNELLDRLAETIQRERRFGIDIAHEIRTPISEIRTLMEVTLRNSKSEDHSALDAEEISVCEATASISRRMSQLIEVLTLIHKGETSSIALDFEPVEPSLVVASAVGALGAESKARCDVVRCDAPLTLLSDPAILRTVIDNLIGNALVYSNPGSRIRIVTDGNRIEISNEVSDLNESDVRHFTAAFWQKEASRSWDGHFGLGLTLVATYINLLGAEIQWKCSDDLLTVFVTLPEDAH